jgi:hypothetical protein
LANPDAVGQTEDEFGFGAEDVAFDDFGDGFGDAAATGGDEFNPFGEPSTVSGGGEADGFDSFDAPTTAATPATEEANPFGNMDEPTPVPVETFDTENNDFAAETSWSDFE